MEEGMATSYLLQMKHSFAKYFIAFMWNIIPILSKT